jgi:hypothetical protein
MAPSILIKLCEIEKIIMNSKGLFICDRHQMCADMQQIQFASACGVWRCKSNSAVRELKIWAKCVGIS